MHRSSLRVVLSLALATSALPELRAQSFVAGDLWARGFVGFQGVVGRIAAAGWQTVANAPLSTNTDDFHFDPYRARILMNGADAQGLRGLYALDASGGTTLVTTTFVAATGIAPAGDGRVYLHLEGLGGGRFRCADAAGVLHVLTDDLTGAPWTPNFVFGGNTAGMTYDAGTNALILATRGNVNVGCGGGPASLVLRKVPLSADGLRVVGPITCLEPFATFFGAPDPFGFSRLPNGHWLLTTNVVTSNPVNPALLAIDPVAFTAAPWATPDFPYAHTIAAGTWSQARGGACLIDLAFDELHVFAPGSSGSGIVSSLGVDLGGAQITEIPVHAPPCDGVFASYGTGLAGTGGFVPRLGARGCPDVGQPFALQLSSGLGGGLAVLAFGPAPASVPLFGGTVLLGQVDLLVPMVLTGPLGVGGAGVGTLPLQFNLPSAVGASLFVQAAVFDSGAVQGLSLSAGLQLTVGP